MLNSDDNQRNSAVSVEPGRRTEQVFNAFAQDEITLIPDTLRLTLGSKFEHKETPQNKRVEYGQLQISGF